MERYGRNNEGRGRGQRPARGGERFSGERRERARGGEQAERSRSGQQGRRPAGGEDRRRTGEGERFGSWSEYIWTLAEKNFEQDGFYKIMVTSGDAAGNLEDSTMSGLPEIRFHIDSTPPELLSVTGMEKAEVRTVSQPVTFLAYDAQGLEGIRVLADGEEIETDRLTAGAAFLFPHPANPVT